MPEITDLDWSKWMSEAQSGDKVSYQKLLSSIVPAIRSFFNKRISDIATVEDLLQSTLLRIHVSRHAFSPKKHFAPWMFTIARNVLNDHLSTVSTRPEILTDSTPVGISGFHEAEETLALKDAISELTPDQMEVLRLIKIMGLSTSEAARLMGISVASLRVRAHRAYKSLKSALQK